MTESRLFKAQKNVFSAVIQNFFNILLTFIARIIFVKILDESYLGINGLFTNILNILSMADLGMATAMMYSLYKPIAESDTKKISALIGFFRKVYLTIAVVVLIVGLCMIPFLEYIVNLDKNIPHLEWYYVLALINVVISYLFVYRTTLVSADQKNYVLNKYIMIFKTITFVVQMIVLVLFKNYFLYLLVAVIISFISNLCQNAVALKMYPYLKQKPQRLEDIEVKNIIRNVKALFIYKISGTIQTNTDNILVSVFVGTVFVGYYSNYALVITAVVSIISLVFTSVKASVGNLIASDNISRAQKLFYFNLNYSR